MLNRNYTELQYSNCIYVRICICSLVTSSDSEGFYGIPPVTKEKAAALLLKQAKGKVHITVFLSS